MKASEKTIPSDDKSTKRSVLLNRAFYGLFVLVGAYLSIAGSEIIYGILNFGMALVFDPFDHRVTWRLRRRYQKVWLFVHVGIFISALAVALVFQLL